MRPSAIQKWLLLLGLILFCLSPQVSAQEERHTVTRIELRTKYASPPPETFLPLIPLKEGGRTTKEQIQLINKALENSGLFRSVSVQVAEEPGEESSDSDAPAKS